MKWVLGYIFAFVLFSVDNIESFAVKVLLQKYLQSDIKHNPIVIKSNNGFIIGAHPKLSVGKLYQQKIISIDSCNKTLIINGKSNQLPCYISPLLSTKHKDILYKSINDWFENNQNFLNEKTVDLNYFFDELMIKKEESSKCLNLYLHDIFIAFINNFVNEFDQNNLVISLQTIEQYVNAFLLDGIKEKFVNQLSIKEISKQNKKLLNQDKEFRHKFLGDEVQKLALSLLQEFILILPRNFLSQILKEDIDCLNVNGTDYLGSFAILQENNFIYLINCLDIDDYLLSVIKNEGWPGWPLEVNKALAITCRTYLVWQVLQAQKSNRPYHIENGIRHQSYKGYHKFYYLKQAIDETRDICIAYENKPILAMFDGCCGGVIPADINHPDYQKYPYLLRTYKCTFCKDFKIATWKKSFSHDEIVKILNKAIPSLQVIDNMAVTKKDKAGLVTDVSIHSKSNIFHITGKKMYSIFCDVVSFCFDIETCQPKTISKNKSKFPKKIKNTISSSNTYQDKRFIISGHGRGHHIGLCQWGAMKLIRDYHWSYQNVLQFYYPGTTLIKLIYQR